MSEVELTLADDRAGWISPMVGAFWADAEHLAVPLVDTTSAVPDPVATGHYEMSRFGTEAAVRAVVSVGIFGTDGTLVEEVPMPTGDLDTADQPHAGLLWLPTGLVRDDRFLLARSPTPDQLELATVDRAGPDRLEPVASLGDLPAGSMTTSEPLAWPYLWLLDGESVWRSLGSVAGLRPGNVYTQLFKLLPGARWPHAWLADGRILAATWWYPDTALGGRHTAEHHLVIEPDTGGVRGGQHQRKQ